MREERLPSVSIGEIVLQLPEQHVVVLCQALRVPWVFKLDKLVKEDSKLPFLGDALLVVLEFDFNLVRA